jgi:hypothetical protein
MELKTVQIPVGKGVGFTIAPSTGSWLRNADNRVQFKSPMMSPSVPVFVRVAGQAGGSMALKVEVSSTGRVRICAPSGSTMSGAKSCEG